MAKRLFDVVVSSIGIVLTSPLLVLFALLIKLTSPGPIFYRGERIGLHGRPFHMLKFRSMVVHAEHLGGSSTSAEDPRITTIGRCLRKLKLDELPQLINVLLGEMSLVGPRPQVPYYVDRFVEEERSIINLRPGITDWASIWNSDEGAVLSGYADPDLAYEELIHPTKTQLQLAYVHNHSVWVDFKIVFYTLARLICPDWTPPELRDYSPPGEKTRNVQRASAA